MEIGFADEAVSDFIRQLNKATIAKVLRSIDLLERFGNELKMPHNKPIGQGLFELRIRGVQEIRIIYTFHRSEAILLHGFIKKTQKLPEKELDIALRKKNRLDTI